MLEAPVPQAGAGTASLDADSHARQASGPRWLEGVLTWLQWTRRSKLDAAHARHAVLRTRLVAARGRIAALRAELASLTRTTDMLRHQVRASRAANGAHVDAIAAILPIRAEAARARGAQDGTARDTRLAGASRAYADARGAWQRGERPLGARRVTTMGIHLTVPPDAGLTGSLSDRLVQGWLPLKDLVHARSFAVGGTMLDIGGNIGTTAIPRVILGDFRCAYVAEPNDLNYRCLVGNVIDNGLSGRVLPDCMAISSVTGTARLRRVSQIGGHRLLADHDPRQVEFDVVPVFTLDEWVERMEIDVDDVRFVKVDTQGWDPHVLAGAPRLLARRDVVWQIEVSRLMRKNAGYSVQDLIALIQAHFSHVRRVDVNDGERIRPASELPELFDGREADGRFVDLLLFNTH